MRDLSRHRGCDLGAVIADVLHIRAAFTPRLARADIHDGDAKERALADTDTRVPDEARRVVDEPQEVRRLHILEEVDVLRSDVLAKGTERLRGSVGAGIDVGPKPQRRDPALVHRVQCLDDVAASLLVLGRDGVLHHHDVALGEIEARADAAVLLHRVERELRIGHDLGCEIDRGATRAVHACRVLAHPDHALAGALRRDEVQVRELRDGVANFLVDRSGDFAALDVGECHVHVRSSHRGGEGLVAIGTREADVRFQVVEHGRELQHAEARRLRHRRRAFALEHHEHALGDLESVRLDDLHRVAVSIEQR